MTECSICGGHGWSEITIWECHGCDELFPDKKGDVYCVKRSKEIIDKYYAMEKALNALLDAKEIKETQGKTPEYEAKKELGWRLAKEVMGRK